MTGRTPVIIQKLLLQVDLKKIKDLQLLLNLLKDVEDYASSNGEMGPDDDPDAAFALALRCHGTLPGKR